MEDLKHFYFPKFNSQYLLLRNKTRKLPKYSLIEELIEYIRDKEIEGVDFLRKSPWHVTLLIKWILSDKDFPNYPKKTLNQNTFNDVLKELENLANLGKMPSDFDHYLLYFRCLAVQQFDFQKGLEGQFFARQSLFYSQLSTDHPINTDFVAHTGITISQYLELSFITYVGLDDSKNGTIHFEWYRKFEQVYGRAVLMNYLALISNTFSEMEAWLQKIKSNNVDNHIRPSEIFEPSTFIDVPFIRLSTKLVCIHRQLFFRSVENYVFRTLRHKDSSKFMKKFGEIFERYAEDTLTDADLKFLTESQLKAKYGVDGLVPDFMVVEDHANIFIEAKAFDMPRQGLVANNRKSLYGKTKGSVIHAVKQAHEIICKLDDAGEPKKENYLLVVTHKEMYLGNGNMFFGEILPEKYEQIFSSYENPISLANIYFISISDLDYLCGIHKKSGGTLKDLIDKAIHDDLQIDRKKFTFSQHIKELAPEMTLPERLDKKFEEMFNELTSKIEKKSVI